MSPVIIPKIPRINDKEPSLKEVQKLVNGYIEIAYDDGETQIVVLNLPNMT